MITADQKNHNILARFETKTIGKSAQVYYGKIDDKIVTMISPADETPEMAIKSFQDKFGAERFGGLVKA